MISIDWGGTNPDAKAKTIAGWYAVAPGGRVYKYREYTSKGKIAEWGADIARLSTGEKISRDMSLILLHGMKEEIQEPLRNSS